MNSNYNCNLVLQEDWYHSEDPVKTGVTFYVKVHLYIHCII